MKVKFKKLSEDAVLPVRSTNMAAGYDLAVPRDIVVVPGRQVIKLDFAMQMPDDIQGLVDPRSGFSAKGFEGFKIDYLGMATGEPVRFDCDVIHGKVDPDYTGCVGIIVHSHETEKFLVKAKSRIAQLTFTKFEVAEWVEVDELDKTERGTGGWGHTGTQPL